MKALLTLIALPVIVVTLAACGGSSSSQHASSTATSSGAGDPRTTTTTPPASSTPAASSTLAVAADPSGGLKYMPSSLSTKAGKVTIDFTNKSPLPHDIVLVNSTNKTLGQTPVFQGGSRSFIVTLTPGTYTYYCSVPGHRQAGMQGTLTVT